MNAFKRYPFFGRVLLLVVAALFIYAPSFKGDFLWDDDDYVTDNCSLRSVSGLKDIWFNPASSPQYYPLVFTSFWLEYQIYGASPLPYRIHNVILHLAVSLLVWRMLIRLNVSGAYLAALLFAVHPVSVESVAWIAERKNVLSALFFMLSLWFCISSFGLVETRRVRRRLPVSAYGVALLCFICALFSKTVTALLPAVVVLLAWWKQKLRIRTVLYLLPFFVLGAAMGLYTAWMEKVHVGADGLEWAFSPVERILIAGRVVWFYLGKLVWPVGLSFIYPRWQIDASQAVQYVYPIAAMALAVVLWMMRSRIGRGAAAAFFIYAVLLFPVMGFLDVYPMRYSFVADHFAYLAGIPVLVLIVSAVSKLKRPLFRGLYSLILVLFILMAHARAAHFQDPETLWKTTLLRNPACLMALNNLGNYYAGRQQHLPAMAMYERALRIDSGSAYTHLNYGNALASAGRFREAENHLKQAIQYHPGDAGMYYSLGRVYQAMGQYSNALVQLNESIQLDPANPEPFLLAANIYSARKQYGRALEHYREAAHRNPADSRIYNNMGNVYAIRGDKENALECYQKAVALDPSYAPAQFNLERMNTFN